MSVHIIAQLKFTCRELYDRYNRASWACSAVQGKLLVADERPDAGRRVPRDKVVIMEFPMMPQRRNFRPRRNTRRSRSTAKRAPTPLC